MRRIFAAAALAASLAPIAAQAADLRPVAASYATPGNLTAGMRAGAATGAKSKFVDGDLVAPILLAAVAFGAGYLVGNAHHHGRRVIVVPVSPN